jgi:hypothetical protein
VRRLLAALALAAASLVAGPTFAQDAPARDDQDTPSREEQLRRIRQLPEEEKARLKEALARFNSLPPERRDELRRKAREVGAERLGELSGRNFEALRRKHQHLRAEMDEIARLLGGPERLASLSPEERAYVRAEAMRGFQRHCRQRLLEGASLAAGFEQLPRAEKKARMDRAVQAAAAKLLEERSPEEQARFATLAPAEQRRERAALLREWRMRETLQFVKRFEGTRLLPLLQMAPERRSALVQQRVRWTQLGGLLQSDGADREAMRMLWQLRCDERAQVAQVYEQSRDLAPVERRARVEQKIRELYGRAALEDDGVQRPPRLPEILRERAMRERRQRARPSADDAPPK